MNYKSVKISEDARISKQSVLVGDVTIGRDSCVLYFTVIRGDEAPVVIGEESNIQENCTVHVSRNMPVHIGNNVTVGHNAVIHGCTIGDRSLIGMGSPAKIKRNLTWEEKLRNLENSKRYVNVSRKMKEQGVL